MKPNVVSVEEHNMDVAASEKMKDPDGSPWRAYLWGKSWDEPRGKTGNGKKFYANCLQGGQVKPQPFYVAIIAPVIYYCMSGLLTTADCEVVAAKGSKPVPRLFVAGEASGGVHGKNRLGANSLLDCVIFGRVASRASSKYMFGANSKFIMYLIDAKNKRVSKIFQG